MLVGLYVNLSLYDIHTRFGAEFEFRDSTILLHSESLRVDSWELREEKGGGVSSFV